MVAEACQKAGAARLLTVVWLVMLSGCATGPDAPPSTVSLAPQTPQAPQPAQAAPSVPSPQGDPSLAEADTAQRFAAWVDAFRESARASGIDDATLHRAFDGVRLIHRAVELDRTQPEFARAIWDYIDTVISPQRVANGQLKLAQFRTEADAASARYGVPAAILMAVWGIESNFGGNYGDVPVIDALATLGFEGRRENWAKSELMAALKILQRGDIDRDHMIGSWAGAMGQTQFMPSSFIAYAVDADGDGRRDIWGSMADVLSSTANYLARSGWRPSETWGTEVQLPSGFDPARADPGVLQSSDQWAAQGVRTLDGTPLPVLADAAILMPAGVRGPAFIVGHNYRTILRYNNAMSYALTVSLLSQRIAGGPAVQAPWPRDLRVLSRSELKQMQSALNQRGFDTGQPDGLLGPATRTALRDFQRSQGLPADGFPTTELLRLLSPQPAP